MIAMAAKSIVICCDGTANHPGQVVDGTLAPTNVALLHEAVADETASGWAQVKWYDPGVGTGTSTVSRRATFLARLARGIVSSLPAWIPDIVSRCFTAIEGATGATIEENIEQGYRELVRLYEPGDRIVLVGFSRGAYTARCIAGVIARCGLLKRDHIRFVPAAIALYRRRTRHSPQPLVATAYTHADPRVHVLALWDTVASLGLPLWGWWFRVGALWRSLPLNIDPAPVCDHVYHGLAMDERRSQFFPTLVTPPAAGGPTVEQVWFRGAHADVGGGYAERQLSDISLAWLERKLTAHGVQLRVPPAPPPAPNDLGPIHDEIARQPGWEALGTWPRWHPIPRPGDGTPAAQALAARFGRLDDSVWRRAEHAGQGWHQRLGAPAGAPGPPPLVDARVAADGFVFLDVGDAVRVTVPADRQWTRTGLVIEEGAAYRLTAAGTWRDADKPPCGPGGQDAAGLDLVRRAFAYVKRRRTGRWMELFGHVAHPRDWPLFELGFFMLLKFLLLQDPAPLVRSLLRLGQHTAAGGAVHVWQKSASGVFYGFPNDCWETYANNSGEVIVEIRRVALIPAGAPCLTIDERGDVAETAGFPQDVDVPPAPDIPPARGTVFGVPGLPDAPRPAAARARADRMPEARPAWERAAPWKRTEL